MIDSIAYKKAIKAINEVHTDTSVPLETTFDMLKGLRDELELLMECVETDLARREG